jgi:hypothetical protein
VQKTWIIAFLLHFLIVLPLPLFRFFLTHRINDSAQGRHILYPAAPVVIVLLITGWDYWLKPVYKKWVGILGVGLLLPWAMFHGWYLWSAYPLPLPVRTTPGPQMQLEQSTRINFGDMLLLTGYQTELASDGSVLQIDLLWQSLTQAWEDYRTEITLVDSHGRPQLRWVNHPADGRFPVRAWQPGDTVRDTLHLPLAGLAPADYEVQLRLLGWAEPFPSTLGEILPLTTITLDSASPLVEATLWQQGKVVDQERATYSFADSPVRPVASLPAGPFTVLPRPATYRYRSTIPVTVPWPAEVSLIGPDSQPRSPVADLGHLRSFVVAHDWPSGDYWLQIDGVDSTLGLQVENFDTGPRRWNFTPPAMMYAIQANFANKIALLGYDLPTRRVQAGGGVPLILYWQGLGQMREDYTIFVQLLDANLKRRGGYDRFPRENYNTYLWVPGEVVDDGFAVPVNADAPDGVYSIRIGLYRQENGQAFPLSPDTR